MHRLHRWPLAEGSQQVRSLGLLSEFEFLTTFWTKSNFAC